MIMRMIMMFPAVLFSVRVMDEFDVFMDAMSRNIAIRQVIEFARKDSSRQFILITPQVHNFACSASSLFNYCCWLLVVAFARVVSGRMRCVGCWCNSIARIALHVQT